MRSINQLTAEVLQELTISANCVETVDSTNTWAKHSFGTEAASPHVYLADHQTQGRGRNGRTWVDNQPGHTLLSTWSFRSTKPMQPIFSPLVGLALFESLQQHWPEIHLCLKAPNDIYIQGNKVAGLLIEMQTGTRPGTQDIFVGLGLNVTSAPKVDQPTTCLEDHSTVNGSNWSPFVATWLQNLKDAIARGENTSLGAETCERLKNALSKETNTQVDRVLPDGSLVKDGHTTLWWEL